MHHLLKQCGIRSLEPPKEGQTITKRTEKMQCHGLRKFFETPVPFYQYMWWVDPLSADSTRYNFYAVGNYGQFIYIIPEKDIVIVRQGYESGYDNWTSLFQELRSNI